MIKNLTTGKIISENEVIAKDLFSQAKGLMFSKRKNLVIFFNNSRKISLHNFFVFFPLEIIVLDSEMKVMAVNKRFLPFTFFSFDKIASYVIELGIEESKGNCKVGDNLEIKEI